MGHASHCPLCGSPLDLMGGCPKLSCALSRAYLAPPPAPGVPPLSDGAREALGEAAREETLDEIERYLKASRPTLAVILPALDRLTREVVGLRFHLEGFEEGLRRFLLLAVLGNTVALMIVALLLAVLLLHR